MHIPAVICKISQFRAPSKMAASQRHCFRTLGWLAVINPSRSIRVRGSLGARGSLPCSADPGGMEAVHNPRTWRLEPSRSTEQKVLLCCSCGRTPLQLRSAFLQSAPAYGLQHIVGVAGSPSDEADAPTSTFRRVWFWAASRGGLVELLRPQNAGAGAATSSLGCSKWARQEPRSRPINPLPDVRGSFPRTVCFPKQVRP